MVLAFGGGVAGGGGWMWSIIVIIVKITDCMANLRTFMNTLLQMFQRTTGNANAMEHGLIF